MREHPMIFNAESVRAILAGRKTMTRRVVKIPRQADDGRQCIVPRCPYGQPGDRLWIREACRAEELSDGLDGVRFLADDAFVPIENTQLASDRWCELNSYRSGRGIVVLPIHMPRWASRITLIITDIRAERLQDISRRDILAEGVGDVYKASEQLRSMFVMTWDRINVARGYPFASNPWVFVVSFRRVDNA